MKYSHFIALIFHFLRELWFIGLELGRKVWATSYETFQNMYLPIYFSLLAPCDANRSKSYHNWLFEMFAPSSLFSTELHHFNLIHE